MNPIFSMSDAALETEIAKRRNAGLARDARALARFRDLRRTFGADGMRKICAACLDADEALNGATANVEE